MIRRIAHGLSYAITGLKLAWVEGFTFKIEIVCAALAIVLSVALNISVIEFMIVILIISSILAAEAFNTALEELCDKFQPTQDPHIAKIKDLSSAALLILSIGAAIVGACIFIPYLI